MLRNYRGNFTVKLLLVAITSFFISCADDQASLKDPVSGKNGQGQIPAEPGDAFSPQTVYFGYDSDALNADSQSSLSSLARYLKSSKGSVQIEGHCDERGSTQYNLALGERRAQSVKQYLMELGVDGNKVSVISYGEEKPAVEGHDESSWSQNRRAEFTLSGSGPYAVLPLP